MPARSLLERGRLAQDPAPAPARAGGAESAARKPHVCFVAPTTWPILSGDRDIPVVGGAEVQQSVIAPALARRGYRVSMICLDYGQPDGVVVDGVTVYKTYKPDEGIPVLRFLHPRLTSLWSTLKRVDADVYYQRTAAIATAVTAEFCRRHGRRSIYAGASDVDFVPGKEDIHYARDRKIFQFGVRRVDKVLVQNEAQRETLRKHYGREATLIPNCYTPPPGARADRGGYVLWVATVRPSKRPELLLELARRMPQHRFVVIGGSDPGRRAAEYQESIRQAAAALPNVEFKGFVPFVEADRFFDGARVVINTSLYEGFPNTFLQAWSRGVPTVAFVDTGSRRDGQPVYDIVPDLDAMALKVSRLMGDDIAWESASRRVAGHFRDNHSVEAIVGLYEREIAPWARSR
ncbi:MAG TPA: glycosyltransferase family 4 protein [Usitatibacter sp.]|nr:glycosyltransferase family 4 protein [Usitatibacter sp.]